jgi:Divergent InlB B-repeat domain/Trypsin
METHALDFRLRANAPEGQKRFAIRRFPLCAMSVLRCRVRWLTPLSALLLLLALHPAAAITRHDGTPRRFEESLISKLPKDQQAMWQGVASGERGTLPFSGVLISDCHILTCAHAFFENSSEGTGQLTADPKTIRFSFPDPADPLNERTPKYQAASVSILPEFIEKKDDGFYGKGHRKVGYDLAIVTLEKCVPDAKPYRYNDGTFIKDERDEKWSKDGGTIKVGYGRGGNGEVGAAFPGGFPRIMTNAVDQFGDGKTKYARNPVKGREDAPPERTLVYDFDKKDENTSDLTNGLTGKPSPFTTWEGSPASGDSGAPLFIMLDKEPIVVGVTSSGSNSQSIYGNVAYDTRVQSYSKWIKDTMEKNPCPTKIPELQETLITAPATSASGEVLTTLKVENGTGDGSYAAGTMVTVTADPAPAGQHFVGWTGDIAILSDANMATTTAMIPSMDVTIAAKYQLDARIGFPIDGN